MSDRSKQRPAGFSVQNVKKRSKYDKASKAGSHEQSCFQVATPCG
jgi:hypothetical protein